MKLSNYYLILLIKKTRMMNKNIRHKPDKVTSRCIKVIDLAKTKDKKSILSKIIEKADKNTGVTLISKSELGQPTRDRILEIMNKVKTVSISYSNILELIAKSQSRET